MENLLTSEQKLAFVREQMAEHNKFVTLALTKYHEALDQEEQYMRAIPDKIREYTETFMQQLTFMLRLL